MKLLPWPTHWKRERSRKPAPRPTAYVKCPAQRGCFHHPLRGGTGVNSTQVTLLKQLLFYDLRMQLETRQASPAKGQGHTPAAWPQPPEDLGCQEQKSWQWNSYALLSGTTCACAASACSIKGCCQQHRCWHQLVAMVEAINVSKPKPPGKPQPGKALLCPGWEPIPCNTQQNTL